MDAVVSSAAIQSLHLRPKPRDCRRSRRKTHATVSNALAMSSFISAEGNPELCRSLQVS